MTIKKIVLLFSYQLTTDILTITFLWRYNMNKESKNNQPLSLYKSQMIQASKSYIANRIAIEGLDIVKNKNKIKEINGIDATKLSNATLQFLQSQGITPKVYKNLRLNAYSKALARIPLVLNGLIDGNITTNYNCLIGSIYDLQKSLKNSKYFTKKELSLTSNSIGRTGGSNPANSMLNVILSIFELAKIDVEIKALYLNTEVAELVKKVVVTSPLVKNHD